MVAKGEVKSWTSQHRKTLSNVIIWVINKQVKYDS